MKMQKRIIQSSIDEWREGGRERGREKEKIDKSEKGASIT